MKVTFVSFIDSDNLGDLLIVKELEEKLLSEFYVEKYSFMFKQLNNKNSLDNNQVKSINPLKRKFKIVYNDYFRKNIVLDYFHTLRIKKILNRNIELSNFEKDISSSDFVVVGGGNAIFDLTPKSDSAFKFEKIFDLAEKYNKKVFVTSIGIGPFQTLKQIERTKSVLKRAHSITLRDKKSWEYLRELPNEPILSIDPVFLLNNSSCISHSVSERKTIGICVIDLLLNKSSNSLNKKYISSTINIVKQLSEKYKVILFSTEKKDYEAVKVVYDKVGIIDSVELTELNNLEDVDKLYNQLDVLLGTRMHSLIIAAAKEVPFVGISWQDKVTEMFKMINMERDYFEIVNVTKSEKDILDHLIFKLENLEEEKRKLKELRIKNRELFKVNIENISDLSFSIKE